MSTMRWISVVVAIVSVVSAREGYQGPGDSYRRGDSYVKCQKPYIPNGDVSPDKYNYYHYDTVYVVCSYGYYESVQTSICGGDGYWHPPLGPTTCRRAICYPPKIYHGVIKPLKKLYYAGSEIQYSCDSNYYHTYKSSICGHDGRWHPEPTSCYLEGYNYKREDYCYAPKHDDYYHNPYGKKEYRHGEKIEYSCAKGYYAPKGYHGYGTCGSGGRFDYAPQKCHRYCDAPEHSKYFHKPSRKTHYKEDEYYEFQCQDGYYLPGGHSYRKLTCHDSHFDHEPYACERYCDGPKYDSYYYKSSSKQYYKHGEYYEIDCEEGYYYPSKYTHRKLTCGHDGKFDFEYHSCEKYCRVPDHSKFYYKRSSRSHLKYGDYYNIDCDDGYYHPAGRSYRKLTCGHDGRYDHEPYKCEKYCRVPDHSTHYYKRSSRSHLKYGEYYDIECDDGYYHPTKHSYRKLTCGHDGRYDHEPYKCEKYCHIPDHSKFYYKRSSRSHLKYGEYYNIDCDDGYYHPSVHSYRKLTCGHDGRYDHEPYKCEKYCQAPAYSSFHHRPSPKRHFKYGEHYDINCRVGYYVPGKHEYKRLTCGRLGAFNHEPYACTPYCRAPSYRQYHYASSKKVHYRAGEKYTIRCASGYRRSQKMSHEYLTCGHNGRFDYSFHACEEHIEYCHAPEYGRYHHQPYGNARFRVGQKINYHCADGYDYPASHSYKYGTCLRGGKFDRNPYACEKRPVHCYPPDHSKFHHRAYSFKEYKVGQKINYHCADGYDHPPKHSYRYGTCLDSGRFDHDPYECNKRPVHCYPPDHSKFHHRAYSFKEYKVGQKINYHCADGYDHPPKHSYRYGTCLDSGRFDHDPYECNKRPVHCYPPDHSKFHHRAYSFKEYKVGQKINYHCADGYDYPTKHSYRYGTCLDSGKFDYNPYECNKRPVHCYPPDHSKFHHRAYSFKEYKVGQKINYHCADGYDHPPKHSYKYGTCLGSGRFDHEPYACNKRPVHCYAPDHSKFFHRAYSFKQYKVGQKINYHCMDGYDHPPKHSYKYGTCLGSGRFDHEPYACNKRPVHCYAPDHSKFFHRQYSFKQYKVGQKINYHCMDGYDHPPKHSYKYGTCLGSGRFDHEPYACNKRPVYCKAPDYRRYQHKSYGKTQFKVGEKISYVCAAGYKRSPSQPYLYGTCLRSGKFTRNPYACIKKVVYCNAPDYRRYQHRSYGKRQYKVGEKISYLCATGYARPHSQSYQYGTCLHSGRFNRNPYACIKRLVYCHAPNFGHYNHRRYSKNQYKVGDRIDYYCADGYHHPKGHSQKYGTCLGTGKFDHAPYACEKKAVYCYPPKHSQYYHRAYSFKQYNVGQRINYHCADGYHQPKGFSHTYGTCLGSGKFDHHAYACERREVHCYPPKYGQFHHREYSLKQYKVGQKINYHCADGYRQPKAHSYTYGTCLGTGRFDHEPYACERHETYCHPPKHSQYFHKEYSYKQYKVGQKINYHCADGYRQPKAHSYTYGTCLGSGKFDHMPYACERHEVYCHPPKYGQLHHREYSHSQYRVGQKINYHCADGYYQPKQHSYTYGTCLGSGKFDRQPYACEKRVFCRAPSYSYYHHAQYTHQQYQVGQRINYNCASGYYRPKASSHTYGTCLGTGSFDHAPYACHKQGIGHSQGYGVGEGYRPDGYSGYCDAPDHYYYHHEKYNKKRYNYGETISYRCSQGYVRPSGYSYSSAKCGKNNQFEYAPYTCTKQGSYGTDHNDGYGVRDGYRDQGYGQSPSYGSSHRSYGTGYPGQGHTGYENGYHGQNRGYPTENDGDHQDGYVDHDDHSSIYCDAPDNSYYRHARYGKKKYNYNEIIHYKCAEGYYRPAKYSYSSAICGSNSQFDHGPFMCLRSKGSYGQSGNNGYYSDRRGPHAGNQHRESHHSGYGGYESDGYGGHRQEGYGGHESNSYGGYGPRGHDGDSHVGYDQDRHSGYSDDDYKGSYCYPPKQPKYYHHVKYSHDRYREGESIKYTCTQGYNRPHGVSYNSSVCKNGKFVNKPYRCQQGYGG